MSLKDFSQNMKTPISLCPKCGEKCVAIDYGQGKGLKDSGIVYCHKVVRDKIMGFPEIKESCIS